MRNHTWLTIVGRQLATFCGLLIAATCCAADRPNVIVILTDDQGWGDFSLNGNTNLETPNIDRLAAEGAAFKRFYVCPVCSPTRAEFLTGRYHPRGGVYSTSAGGERLDLDEVTIGETFQAGGYRTAAFGKWHNGMQFPYHPNARGFDEYYGFCSGHWGHYFSPLLDHNGRIVQGDGFLIDDLTDHAIDFIRDQNDRPFFVYLPYNTPHSPMQVPDRWWNKFKDAELKLHNREPKKENLQHIRAALAMCENIDFNVGRLMEALKESGQDENTIVVYFCDNGPNGVRWNGDMKGRKGSTDEGGVRSPCIVRWPAGIKSGTKVSANGAAIDLHPTLAAMADVEPVNEKPFDGINLAPLLTKNGGDPPSNIDQRIIVSHWRNRVSAKMGSYRLDHQGALFSLDNDPGQRQDVSDQHPEVKQRMQVAVDHYKNELLPGYDDDQRPFVLAHPAHPVTQVPARDGKAHGNIKRSNRFPNSSFFTNWTSTEDKITWDAEVAADGIYEVELFYSCPNGQEGSTIQLSFNDAQLTTTLNEPHPSELVGAEQDRVERQESYEQNWGRTVLGDIRLQAGVGTLTLQATKVPGMQVMDFRLLTLTRKTN
ncbi:MAG: arylsulfatase [Fuerstiella sp.]